MKKRTHKVKLLYVTLTCVILSCVFFRSENTKIKTVNSEYKRIKAYYPVKAGKYYFWCQSTGNQSDFDIYYSTTRNGKGKQIVSSTKKHSVYPYGYTDGKQLFYVTSLKKSSKSSTLHSINLSDRTKIKYVTDKSLFNITNVYGNNIFYETSENPEMNIKKVSLKKPYKVKTEIKDFLPCYLVDRSTRYLHGYGKVISERRLKVYDCKTGKLNNIASHVYTAQLKNKKLYYAVSKNNSDSMGMKTFIIYYCPQNGKGEKINIASLKAVNIGSIDFSSIYYDKIDKDQLPHHTYYYYNIKQKNPIRLHQKNLNDNYS